MEYRELPKTGWKVSAVSYGCMSLALGTGSRAQGAESVATSADKVHSTPERLLQKAVDLGINFFDTADLYDQGENERVVGRALGAMRQEVFIATKVGNQLRPDGSGWDWNPSKEYILKAVDESLKRLQTDYIDLYQLHGGTLEDPIDETIEAFERLKDQGKIRAYGISSIRPNVISEYVARSQMVSVMMQYSLLDRRPEESCLSLLKDHNIGVLVRGAVAKGMLIDKPAQEYLGYSEQETARARALVKDISNKDLTPAQVALQFVLRNSAVYSVAAGMRTMEQLKENTAKGVPSLTDAQYHQLHTALPPNQYQAHR